VHRATFYNQFTSVEGAAACAICIGFEECQLLDRGDRHLGADLMNVALLTVRAILDHLSEHRELHRLALSWRSGATTPLPGRRSRPPRIAEMLFHCCRCG
jgi:hypothetical protein